MDCSIDQRRVYKWNHLSVYIVINKTVIKFIKWMCQIYSGSEFNRLKALICGYKFNFNISMKIYYWKGMHFKWKLNVIYI